MRYPVTLFTFILTLCFSVNGLADKPSWAGEGGQPTAGEKEQHKEAMTSKHENKEKAKYKNEEKEKNEHRNKDKEKDQNRDREKQKESD